jgi:hypothetical protein
MNAGTGNGHVEDPGAAVRELEPGCGKRGYGDENGPEQPQPDADAEAPTKRRAGRAAGEPSPRAGVVDRGKLGPHRCAPFRAIAGKACRRDGEKTLGAVSNAGAHVSAVRITGRDGAAGVGVAVG